MIMIFCDHLKWDFSGQWSDVAVMDQTTKKGSQMNLRFSVKNKSLQKIFSALFCDEWYMKYKRQRSNRKR